MTKPKYASAEERRAALSVKARLQMRAQWEAHRGESGEPLGYFGKHRRVRAARGSASDYACIRCAAPARHWAQIHGTDGSDPGDYQPMCQRCHWAYDDIPKRLSRSTPARRQAALDRWAKKSPHERKAIAAKALATREANRASVASPSSRTG